MRHPAARFGSTEEFGKCSIDGGRFFAVNCVSGARNNKQPRRGSHALQEETSVEAWEVLVPHDYQQWHGAALQTLLQIPQCGPFKLEVEHGDGRARAGMSREHALELSEAPGVFRLKGLPH